jgi:hypothetical protein
MSEIRHRLPKALIGDNGTDASQLVHPCICLTYGCVCLNHGCALLCIVELYENIAGFDLLPLSHVDCLDEAR